MARDGAQPNQLVQPGLVGIEIALGVARPAGQVGRTNGFVRFLRILGLGLVAARRLRNVVPAVVALDHAPDCADRFAGDIDAIGSHIGDQADCFAADIDTFIEPLRHAHRVGRRKAELAACFLLQGRGRKRRVGVPLDGLGFHRSDAESGGFKGLLECLGFGTRADVQALQLLAVGADQARFEALPAGRRKRRDQRPVFLTNEFFDFEFAIANEPQGN